MPRMKFLVFITVISVIGLFHRREHVRYENELYIERKPNKSSFWQYLAGYCQLSDVVLAQL